MCHIVDEMRDVLGTKLYGVRVGGRYGGRADYVGGDSISGVGCAGAECQEVEQHTCQFGRPGLIAPEWIRGIECGKAVDGEWDARIEQANDRAGVACEVHRLLVTHLRVLSAESIFVL